MPRSAGGPDSSVLQKGGIDRAIADATDGLRDTLPGQGIRIGQDLHEGGERGRVADQPDGPRRRGADGGIAILEQAQ